jgi:uncharacterized protein YkwD
VVLRILPRLTILLLALAIAVPGVAHAQAAAAGPVLSSAEQDALAQINAYRTSLGLRPVRLDPMLQREAEWYAADMAAHDNFSHDHRDSLGRLPAERLNAFGYRFADMAAENTAAGYPDGADTFQQWRNSPPHDRTMRESTYRLIGIAMAYAPNTSSEWYWVSAYGPDAVTAAHEEAAEGTISVTIRVPVLPLVVLRHCTPLQAHERCVRAASNTERAPTELQVQRRVNGVWSRTTYTSDEHVTLRVRPGGATRVRVLAYDEDNRWPTRGPWRVIRP